MHSKNSAVVATAAIIVFFTAIAADNFASASSSPPQEAGQSAVTRRIGAIKAVNGTTITLAPDSGPEVSITISPTTRILQVAPGEKTLKNAVPMQLTDLQIGDRILVGGVASADAKSITASSVVVMKLSAVEARQSQERQDWQKRGLGGLVKSVDPATGTVTITVASFGGTKTIAVHASKTTVIRRYAPDSVKFDDAKVSTLDAIHPGDQLRALGDRSADGSELNAEEIVTGSFRNVAGTVNSVDASSGTVSVQDLLSKKAVLVKVTADSQLHQLPPEVAQRIAMRLKGSMPPGAPGGGSPSSASPQTAGNGAQSASSSAGTQPEGGRMSGMRQGGAPDFQQMLSRMPAVTLSDLHKGDAVLIVTTEGSADAAGTAITLLSGVDPILRAAPEGSQAMMLAPWSLGGAPPADASQ